MAADPRSLRTIFLGTPEIAVPALRLLAARTAVSCVITQPDRPAGRGMHLAPPPVKIAAQELQLPVWQPDTLKGQGADPRLDCDLAVVMAYGELLRQDVLDRPRLGCVNLHGSLLPRWRGASPLQAAIRAGDTSTGVTVMRMVRALDAGAMFLRVEVPIGPRTALPELHDAMATAAAQALGRYLDDHAIVPVPQDESQVTVCRKLTAEDGRLDLALGAAAVDRWIRAYTPAPGCWLPYAAGPANAGGTDRLRMLSALPDAAALPVGEVLISDGRLWLGCGADRIEVLRLQAPGKRAMDTADFLRGTNLIRHAGGWWQGVGR
jgi:methionyl-tRNA formyltransferase